MNDQIEGKTDNSEKNRRKGCGSGCIIAVIISVALLSAVFIFGGIFLLLAGIIGEDSGAFSGSLSKFSIAPNDGLQERFVDGKAFSSNKIALIEVRGVITEYDSGGMWETADASLIVNQLNRAQNDPDVKAVILYLDTPGGGVIAADNIYKKIQDLRSSGKIVVTYMNTVAASGGYYIAVASDFIVAHRMCITGSIGVIMQGYNYKGLLDKIGVHTETYKSGEMKDMLDGSRERTEAERQLAQELIQKIYSEFVEIVARGRENLSVDEIKNSQIGDGRIFLGSEAAELGMVDKVGYYEDALDAALELASIPSDDYRIVTYKKLLSFVDIFAKMENSHGKININLGRMKSWDAILEPGKPYFLPAR